ncbi:hypothetical protein BD414DRAFT_506494 [Trametes punicea]|nr:hypothetical protein BD414DRAFT_504475 [Trametes punicea]KAI8993961.1 hypothetical protein BD414DRAFT_506494 [Trametes punicea]
MFANKFVTLLAALVAAASAVSAAPLDVINPVVMSPKAGDVWHIGTIQNVTWDTSGISPSDANHTGLILLGFIEGDSTDEHLDTKHPLAVNFPIGAGSVIVEVPDVTPRDDYVVVLFGDSGNTSPKFTITA